MVNLDYFYGSEGEQYRFYQIPAVLLEDDEYKKISDTAKILYGILLSRLAMSKKNNWIEEDTNRVYILYNRNDIAKKMGRSPNTISNAMNQLLEVGLIKRKRQGQGKADMLYVMNFSSREHNKKIDMPCKEEKEVSVSSDQPHSFYENREEKVYTNDIDIPSPQNKRTAYREIIKKQVDYEILRQSSYDMNIIDNMLIREIGEKQFGYVSNCESLINMLLILLHRECNQAEERLTDLERRKYCEKVNSYVQKHYLDNPSMEFLANKFGYSGNAQMLRRDFLRFYGVTPVAISKVKKLEEAKRLLVTTTYSMNEIAVILKYKSNTHFGADFKRSTGMTPVEYRKNIRAEREKQIQAENHQMNLEEYLAKTC